MRGRQIAVCCEEEGYVRRFSDYANGQKDSLFAVHGFTSIRELTAYRKEHPAEILLISEGLWREYSGVLEAGEIFLLTKETISRKVNRLVSLSISPAGRF